MNKKIIPITTIFLILTKNFHVLKPDYLTQEIDLILKNSKINVTKIEKHYERIFFITLTIVTI